MKGIDRSMGSGAKGEQGEREAEPWGWHRLSTLNATRMALYLSCYYHTQHTKHLVVDPTTFFWSTHVTQRWAEVELQGGKIFIDWTGIVIYNKDSTTNRKQGPRYTIARAEQCSAERTVTLGTDINGGRSTVHKMWR